MHTNHLRVLLVLTCLTAGFASTVRAQIDEAKLAKNCVSVLIKFANKAKAKKVGPRALQALNLVLEYDPDQKRARSELGFRKVKGEWVGLPKEKRKKWRDKAKYNDRYKILEEWAKTATALSVQHAKLGLKLQQDGSSARAIYHLEKAVYYNPNNEEANVALGYKKGDGFYGTDDQIAFAERMKVVEVKAVEFARQDYEVQELSPDQPPVEFRNLMDNAPEWMLKPSFEIHGAKSPRFCVWVRGSQQLANDCCMWAERATDFMVWLIGDEQAKRLRFVERATGRWAWQGFLATRREREAFLKSNPGVLNGASVSDGMRFANNVWRAQDGVAVMKVG